MKPPNISIVFVLFYFFGTSAARSDTFGRLEDHENMDQVQELLDDPDLPSGFESTDETSTSATVAKIQTSVVYVCGDADDDSSIGSLIF